MTGWRTWVIAALVLLASCADEAPRVAPTPSPTLPPSGADVSAPAPGPDRSSAPEPSTAQTTDYIRAHFGAQGDKAVAVADCESKGFKPTVVAGDELGPVGEVGVFQIRPELHAWRVKAVGGTSLRDWRTNVRVAAHLFDAKGWHPWKACL